MQVGDRSGLVNWEELITATGPALNLLARDESLEESDNLPDPDVLAQDIVEDLEGAFEPFREIAPDLSTEHANPKETKETAPAP